MEGSTIYLITLLSVAGMIWFSLLGWLLAKKGLEANLTILLIGIGVIFLLAIPGAIWSDDEQRVKAVEGVFEELADGKLLYWQHDDRNTWSAEVRWIDAEGQYRTSIIIVNPWTEPAILEEQ